MDLLPVFHQYCKPRLVSEECDWLKSLRQFGHFCVVEVNCLKTAHSYLRSCEISQRASMRVFFSFSFSLSLSLFLSVFVLISFFLLI